MTVLSNNPALFIRALALALAACTSAISAESRFTGMRWSSTGPTLSWQDPSPGAAFTLQYKDRLTDLIWRVPAEFPYPSESSGYNDATAPAGSRFYRLLSVPRPERGGLLSVTPAGGYNTVSLGFIFGIAGVPVTPKYDVQLFKLSYSTLSPWGAPTRASGVLIVPSGVPQAIPTAMYLHGTIVVTNDAPSALPSNSEVIIGVALASSGYAAVLPDYLGLGESPGLHPYHHARSEASAAIDMLRAVRAFAASNSLALSDKLFLSGYSQGGHAAMATLKEIETHHSPEFNVVACAPMAGAYDLSGTTVSDFLSGRPQPNPYYFLYLLASYQEVYGLSGSLGELLAAPYNTTLPPLLNGAVSSSQINAQMPSDPTKILKPEQLAAFRADPRHPLRLALEDNDLIRWTPRTPLRLFHCSGDQDVAPANSQTAYQSFTSRGVTNVLLLDPLPGADHGSCAQPALLAAKAWFDSLR